VVVPLRKVGRKLMCFYSIQAKHLRFVTHFQ
jgi:hypothetical protein